MKRQESDNRGTDALTLNRALVDELKKQLRLSRYFWPVRTVLGEFASAVR